jgi:TPR repeat protein
VLLAEVAIWLAAGERLQQWLGVMVIGAKVSQPAPPAPAPALPGGSPVDLYDLLVPGARSPSGIDAAGVSADRALALASESLQGSERRNTVEGAFWLRRYLAERIGSPVTARALTQLGSALAEPSAGAPDYARAHRAWQMAAAYGDPVAMCFLAALHASGLGVPADKAAAERWQAAAQAAGGCAGSGKP